MTDKAFAGKLIVVFHIGTDITNLLANTINMTWYNQ